MRFRIYFRNKNTFRNQFPKQKVFRNAFPNLFPRRFSQRLRAVSQRLRVPSRGFRASLTEMAFVSEMLFRKWPLVSDFCFGNGFLFRIHGSEWGKAFQNGVLWFIRFAFSHTAQNDRGSVSYSHLGPGSADRTCGIPQKHGARGLSSGGREAGGGLLQGAGEAIGRA